MGVLNVTPDSFSDGGDFQSLDQATARARQMIDEGAAIIDVGPESTRPGSLPVEPSEQIRRAVPVIRAIREQHAGIALSIDTRIAAVAEAAIEAGADLVNDVSALRDDARMIEVVAESGASLVLMHRKGTPADMQADGGPRYDDVVSEISAFLEERNEFAAAHGVDPSRILFDPGIGFGKRLEHNLEILGRLDAFVSLGRPVVVGASRKSFLGQILGVAEPKQRLAGSLSCAAMAALSGAAVLRVHDVAETVQMVRICRGIRDRGSSFTSRD